MMTDVDSDVPDTGAAFTFGKTKFSSDVPGKFWIRDDPILQVACGDEHTALLTASGRVFTFGSNEWGQLGHGHTNALTKPSCVKCLKYERATLVACGRSHTLVATDTGHVYGFGANGEGQLGSPNEYTIHTSPVRVQGLEDVAIKMLSAGADHSIALTDKGCVYVWGGGSEGQLGMERSQCLAPTELKFESAVMCISAGYYHSAFVTVDGKLYTCGENDCGKLGVPESNVKKSSNLNHVTGISGKVVYVSCGGNHTVALTADGRAYSFGNGFNGQLGLGDRIVEASTPHLVSFLGKDKVARVSCGESHTGFLTDTSCLYTCGDRRHGKLGLLDEEESNTYCSQFLPTLVTRFQNFQVQQVACGGCHMLVLATRKKTAPPTLVSQSLGMVCPERQRRTELPPVQSVSSTSSFQLKKTPGSATSLKPGHRPRLPSITKSPVWYVPLEKVNDGAADQNSDDEVLSKLEHRCSLLDELECDASIRHVDSDVESDNQEEPELNKTHTLERVDNTLDIVRPVISDSAHNLQTNTDCSVELSKPIVMDSIQKNNSAELTASNQLDGVISASSSVPDNVPDNTQVSKKGTTKQNSPNKVEEGKSQFYINEEKSVASPKSSSSTLSKSSKACTLL